MPATNASSAMRLSGIGMLVLFLLSGCVQQNEPPTAIPPITGEFVSAGELARNLGYAVVQSDASFAQLSKSGNTLMIFADPVSEIYFNNRLLLRSPGIVSAGGQTFLSVAVASRIHQALGMPAQYAPTPVAPRPVYRGPISGRVVLDAGHGGKDPGTHSPHGMLEKNLVLAIARAAAGKLQQRGVSVLLTRNRDVFVELDDRASTANRFRANLFVSIHADSNPSPEKFGHSILLPQSGNPWSLYAAQWINRYLVAVGSPSHIIRTDNRGLVVLRKTTCPAILVEVGFMSNASDAQRLASPAFQDRLAEALADGIVEYLRGSRR